MESVKISPKKCKTAMALAGPHRHVKRHDNISLFKVIYLSSKLKALYLQLHQVITIYKLSINFWTPCI